MQNRRFGSDDEQPVNDLNKYVQIGVPLYIQNYLLVASRNMYHYQIFLDETKSVSGVSTK